MRLTFSSIWWSLSLLILFTELVLCGEDYYAILGVRKDSTSREIKKKYKQLSKKYHPDKNPGDKEAEEKFVQLAQGKQGSRSDRLLTNYPS